MQTAWGEQVYQPTPLTLQAQTDSAIKSCALICWQLSTLGTQLNCTQGCKVHTQHPYVAVVCTSHPALTLASKTSRSLATSNTQPNALMPSPYMMSNSATSKGGET